MKKDPWSPWAVFGFTVFTGPFIGGVMGIMNYDRLNMKGKEKWIALVLLIASIVLPFIPLLGFDKLGITLTRDISRLLNGFKLILAFYLFGTQKDHFDHYIKMGGSKASLKGPVLVVAAVFIVILLIASSALKDFRII